MNLFIGSSSIGVFKLFKNKKYKVIKISGGTAKGLYTNQNGQNIIETIKNIKSPINCIVLHFGEVDINFSYYYEVCNSIDKNINYIEFCNDVYNKYITFIDKIVDISKCKNLIIKGLYPNPVKDIFKGKQLIYYSIIDNIDCLQESTLNFKFQEKLRKYYNNLLRNYCIAKNKLNNIKIKTNYFYYDLDKYIINNGKINNKCIDVSVTTIHLRWEPMVYYHVNILNKICGISKNELINIKKEETKYLKYKINKLKNKKYTKKLKLKLKQKK
jgi:hypothetical protein